MAFQRMGSGASGGTSDVDICYYDPVGGAGGAIGSDGTMYTSYPKTSSRQFTANLTYISVYCSYSNAKTTVTALQDCNIVGYMTAQTQATPTDISGSYSAGDVIVDGNYSVLLHASK